MSMQTTREISRETAIERIVAIRNLAQSEDYVAIEKITNETEHSLQSFVQEALEGELTYLRNINKWTNKMLEEQINKPFFRFSRLDNYSVSNTM